MFNGLDLVLLKPLPSFQLVHPINAEDTESHQNLLLILAKMTVFAFFK